MDVGILHLTDLHLNPKDNFIIDKIEEINNALKIEINQFERLYIVVTGDIVDRGAKEAYNFARKFLLDLKESLETINKHLVIKFIIVPGNHDCNFKEYDNQLRKNAIKSINY